MLTRFITRQADLIASWVVVSHMRLVGRWHGTDDRHTRVAGAVCWWPMDPCRPSSLFEITAKALSIHFRLFRTSSFHFRMLRSICGDKPCWSNALGIVANEGHLDWLLVRVFRPRLNYTRCRNLGSLCGLVTHPRALTKSPDPCHWIACWKIYWFHAPASFIIINTNLIEMEWDILRIWLCNQVAIIFHPSTYRLIEIVGLASCYHLSISRPA